LAKVCFDIDGVIARFDLAYGKAIIEVTKRNLLPEGWETSPDFPATWYWDRDAGYTKDEEKKTWNTRILNSTSFWKNLAPLPGSKEVMKQLNRLAREGSDIYFLTHRMGKRAKSQTEEFLYNLGCNYPTVILSGNKAPFAEAVGGLDLYCDDKLSTIEEFATSGLVKNLFLKAAPYNVEGRTNNGYRVVGSASEALSVAGLWKGYPVETV